MAKEKVPKATKEKAEKPAVIKKATPKKVVAPAVTPEQVSTNVIPVVVTDAPDAGKGEAVQVNNDGTPPVITAPAEVIADTAGEDVNEEAAMAERMEPYVKAYPGEKLFLIASDGQVFLSANALDAEAHQTFIDAGKHLEKFHVNL